MAAIVKCQDSKALVFRQRRMEEKKQTGIKKEETSDQGQVGEEE